MEAVIVTILCALIGICPVVEASKSVKAEQAREMQRVEANFPDEEAN